MISEREEGGGGKKIIFNVKYRPLSVGIILFGFGSSIIKQIRYGSLSRPRQKRYVRIQSSLKIRTNAN